MIFRKRTLQERFWETLPGVQFWTVFFGAILLSAYKPIWAAIFIICFDFYWVLKAINVAVHLIASYKKFRVATKLDWLDFAGKLQNFQAFTEQLSGLETSATTFTGKEFFKAEKNKIQKLIAEGRTGGDYQHYYQLVLIPFVDEGFEVLDSTVSALAACNYPKEKMIVLLGCEERGGAAARQAAEQIKQKYASKFFKFYISVHPDGLEGEIKGKSANASFAVKTIMPELEKLGITVPQVLVSNFDSDSIVHPQYFARVIYEFLTAKNPYQSSYQPIAIYNNNIWDSPAFVRIVSVSNSFWQFTESSRPDRLRTFSSHTMTLKALIEVGFWKKDIINE
ncbi:MAG TPA: hypothetical protein VE973_03055, partial [Candidatus Limnocylindria bacterium]|nr:hypothetical protein [Candidatus Limnocylindria bacterium]